jgi:hypothetical protein
MNQMFCSLITDFIATEVEYGECLREKSGDANDRDREK